MPDRRKSPNAVLRRDSFLDIDAQAAQLSGHDQLYRQLSSGQFKGSFTTIEEPGGTGIYVEQVNQVIEQAGVVPNGQVSILFLTGGQQPVRLGCADFAPSRFTIAGPGEVIEFQSAKDTEVCVVSLPGRDFEALSEATPYRKFAHAGISTYDNPEITAVLRRRVGELTAAAFPKEEVPGPLPSLSSWMGDVLTEAFGLSGRGSPASTHLRTDQRADIFRTARSMILDALDRISVQVLSHQLQVSRRTLEYVFQDRVGVSPHNYIQALRLDAIRRDILRTDEPIGDIAARYGVWHMSRLAARYRNAFGQLPSESRRNHLRS